MYNVDEDAGERETLNNVVGNETGAAMAQNSVEVPQKLKETGQHDPASPLLGTHLKKMETLI